MSLGLRAACEQVPGVEVVVNLADGEELLRECRAGSVRLAICDPGVLEPDVTAFAAALAATSATVLLFTNSADPSYTATLLRAGVRGFIPRNANVEKFTTAVETAARRELVLERDVLSLVTQSLLTAHDESPTARLTRREHEVLDLVAGGMSNRTIARQLSLGESTVKTHLENVYEKLDAPSRTAAVVRAMRLGLLDPA